MKIIAFLSNKLTLRGTEVAMYDYAHFNETILGNKSIIITRSYEITKNEIDSDEKAYKKFSDRFEMGYYNDISDIDDLLESFKCDLLYVIKSGQNDKLYSKKIKTMIHCVFDMSQPHGDIYVGISDFVVKKYGNEKYHVLPHIINIPNIDENLKHSLNIPENALVFGRYGGYDSFDIKFVHNVIEDIATKYSNIYFLFMNTINFCKKKHNNIIFLEGVTDLEYKSKFINTCDALIHARKSGETFGLTCGEFAIKNKVVITYGHSKDTAHLDIMGNNCIIYNNEKELGKILRNYDIYKSKIDVDNNGYKKFIPEYVMNIFRELIE